MEEHRFSGLQDSIVCPRERNLIFTQKCFPLQKKRLKVLFLRQPLRSILTWKNFDANNLDGPECTETDWELNPFRAFFLWLRKFPAGCIHFYRKAGIAGGFCFSWSHNVLVLHTCWDPTSKIRFWLEKVFLFLCWALFYSPWVFFLQLTSDWCGKRGKAFEWERIWNKWPWRSQGTLASRIHSSDHHQNFFLDKKLKDLTW